MKILTVPGPEVPAILFQETGSDLLLLTFIKFTFVAFLSILFYDLFEVGTFQNTFVNSNVYNIGK